MEKIYHKIIGGREVRSYCTAIITEDGTISNPTEEQILAAGWTEYVAPPLTLEQVKAAKLAELAAYDNLESPDGVNWFYLEGMGSWIHESNRMGLLAEMNLLERRGEGTIGLVFGGQTMTLPISDTETMNGARTLLEDLQHYATESLKVTSIHRANINALTTTESVNAYDFRTGYPEKLHLTVLKQNQ